MAGQCRWLILLLVSGLCGCATGGAVRLETGRRDPLVYRPPSDARVVAVGQREFLETVARLALDRRLPLQLQHELGRVQLVSWQAEGRPGWGRSAGFGGRRNGPWDRLTLVGAATSLGETERRDFALSAALDSVWEGVAQAVRATVDPLALRAMVVSALGAYMLLVLAPEPVTKFIAIALTAYLIAYVGLGPLWSMVEAYRALLGESERATTLRQLEEAGHRFGKVVGDNGARVLIMVVLAAAGGQAGMAAKGPGLPGYSRALVNSGRNAGFRLGAVADGGVRAVTVRPGALIMTVVPTAVATTAWEGSGGGGPRRQGSLTGRPSRPKRDNDKKPENVRAIERENESAQTLADNGYDVEQNPPGPSHKDMHPDYRINGEYGDCYAPSTDKPRNVWERIQDKVVRDQARNIILNLDDSLLNLDALKEQLIDWPIPGLKRVIVVKGGRVIPFFPW